MVEAGHSYGTAQAILAPYSQTGHSVWHKQDTDTSQVGFYLPPPLSWEMTNCHTFRTLDCAHESTIIKIKTAYLNAHSQSAFT